MKPPQQPAVHGRIEALNKVYRAIKRHRQEVHSWTPTNAVKHRWKSHIFSH